MYGVLDLVKKCKEKGIKPIIGNEMYVINGSIDDPQPKKEKRYHLVVLAKNYTGYKNLVKLTTISHLNGMRGRGIFSRPCIDKSLLSKYSDGLIVSTAVETIRPSLYLLKRDLSIHGLEKMPRPLIPFR